jgi:ParB-like chromosome segregation protein Spo0J
MTTSAIKNIKVGDRCRADMGDLRSLANSIETLGLLHPIVVGPDGALIAGARRLAACKSLGWTQVPTTVVASMTDAAELLKAERDENTCRKDFAPSEAVALGKQLEALERPAAAERKAATMQNLRNVGAGNVPAPSDPGARGDVREKVGAAVGMSGRTYDRAKTVVEAQSHPDPDIAAAAAEAVAEMDATGQVTPAARKVAQAKVKAGEPVAFKSREAIRERIRRVQEMSEAGHSSRQIAGTLGISPDRVREIARDLGISITADAIVGRNPRHDPNRIIAEMVSTLEALAMSVDLVAVADIDPERIEDWVTSLSDSLKTMTRFHKQLKEMTQ